MKTLGTIVRESREKRHITRQKAAKRLQITEGYLGHIERDAPVRVSPRVVIALKKMGIKVPSTLVEKHNIKSRKWYRAYRKKTA